MFTIPQDLGQFLTPDATQLTSVRYDYIDEAELLPFDVLHNFYSIGRRVILMKHHQLRL